jgi:hypothetical protein
VLVLAPIQGGRRASRQKSTKEVQNESRLVRGSSKRNVSRSGEENLYQSFRALLVPHVPKKKPVAERLSAKKRHLPRALAYSGPMLVDSNGSAFVRIQDLDAFLNKTVWL